MYAHLCPFTYAHRASGIKCLTTKQTHDFRRGDIFKDLEGRQYPPLAVRLSFLSQLVKFFANSVLSLCHISLFLSMGRQKFKPRIPTKTCLARSYLRYASFFCPTTSEKHVLANSYGYEQVSEYKPRRSSFLFYIFSFLFIYLFLTDDKSLSFETGWFVS